MRQSFFVIAFFLITLIFLGNSYVNAQQRTGILGDGELAKVGLKKLWQNQIRIDQTLEKISHVVIYDGVIFIITNNADLHAIDGETGKTLWRRSLGPRDRYCLPPTANSRMVATICGLEALVFDRSNGKLLLSIDLHEPPGNGCELSETYLYIPLLSGKMLAFYLREPAYAEDEAVENTALEGFKKMTMEFASEEDPDIARMKDEFKRAREMFNEEKPLDAAPRPLALDRTYTAPLACPSFGNSMVPPTLGSQFVEMTTVANNSLSVKESVEYISWTTDRGIMHIASIDRNRNGQDDAVLLLRYQVKIVNQAFYVDSSRIVKRELEQRVDIPAKPTFVQPRPLNADIDNFERPGIMILGTNTGYVLATMDRTGTSLWEFYAGAPVLEPIVVIPEQQNRDEKPAATAKPENDLAEEPEIVADVAQEIDLQEEFLNDDELEYAYISTPKGMYSVGLVSGKARWFSDGVCKFLAASDERIYGFTNTMDFVVLDRKTGGRLGSFPAAVFYENSLNNPENDRVYIISPSGLVQCLSEIRTEEDDRKAGIAFFARIIDEAPTLSPNEKENLIELISKPASGENVLLEQEAISDAWKQARSILHEKEKNMSDEDRRILRLQMRTPPPIRHGLSSKEIEELFKGIRNGTLEMLGPSPNRPNRGAGVNPFQSVGEPGDAPINIFPQGDIIDEDENEDESAPGFDDQGY